MISSLDYSEDVLTVDLRSWWDDQVADADPFAYPVLRRPETIFEVVPEIDSLAVVTALITIEKHVKFEVPPRIIKPGGYRSFDEMKDDLLPKVRDLVNKKLKKEAA